MRDQVFQQTPTMRVAPAIMTQPNHSFVGSSSFNSDDPKSNTHFEFNISRDLLIDRNDIMVGEMIGERGSSLVYKGLFKNQVPVAVKMMQPSRTSAVTREQKEKFEKEVLLLSKINHENIVKFIGACIEPQLMIVTELLEGGTLQRTMWNARPNTLEPKVSLNYALNISRAMELLHSKGIIHRDLKPGNILVTGDMTQVKIADFGTAREETADYMTSEVGTYRWMAPEVFSREPLKVGEKLQYDHKVDVYSFAMILWELLSNKTPFGGQSSLFVPYLIIIQNQRPSLRNIPDGAVSILESCWAKDPNRRPEFKEIIIFLENLLRCLCPDTNGAATTSNQEINIDKTEYSEINLNQRYNRQDMEPEEKIKKKKVVNMTSPFFSMFRHCYFIKIKE